ncbi:MAG: Lrp/AsnC family transcriptional regulator [Rhodospirillales bacterium]|nr:MAG: Lrp/AsnC family transcriptional regulator [Rhodospirillales bacterium]
MNVGRFGDLERRLLDDFQRDFPLEPRPYKVIAERLGCDEETVLDLLCGMITAGLISRIGPVFAPHRAGASTLGAMAVPAHRLDEVAALVSEYDEVNHNYEREHEINLWFVVCAPAPARVAEVMRDIADRTGLAVIDLPLEQAFHIDLGFPLQWS